MAKKNKREKAPHSQVGSIPKVYPRPLLTLTSLRFAPLNLGEDDEAYESGYGMFDGATLFDQDLSSWDVSSVVGMWDAFIGSALSRAHYDALLIEWAKQTLQSGVRFDCDAQYSAGEAAAAREFIVTNFGWEINDGGEAP